MKRTPFYLSPTSALLAALLLMMLAHIPIETESASFSCPTILLYVCGTAAVVFFINRRQEFDQETSEKPHV